MSDVHISKSRSRYQIISLTAYLLGVPKRIFENENEPPLLEEYDKLEKNPSAKIVRNLCLLRTTIERNFKSINQQMQLEYRSLYTVKEIDQKILSELEDEGIRIVSKNNLACHIVEINRHFSNRINNCKNLYPTWINWEYVKKLFLMPNGFAEAGTKAAAERYYENRAKYPYQVYLNWNPGEDGNILYNDQKFVELLYKQNQDTFTDLSKVSDAGEHTKGSIYQFLENPTVVMVDCENSDPYKLCATLKNLDDGELRNIKKIILFDDVHTTAAWQILEKHLKHLVIEHRMIERVKENKSLVDIQLTAHACQEYYQNHIDSFILVSSDSDYWGLIKSLPEARFLVMVEREKCGPDIKAAMDKANIFYCYIDDFYSGDSDLKINALIQELYRYLDQTIQLNVHEMLDHAFWSTRVEMSDEEQQEFYKKYIRTMHLEIDEGGNVSVKLGK